MSRLPFIDWVRGFAVVAMVLWHSGDAWLAPGLKAGQGWLFLRFVGGLAAPTFLLLAGVGSALATKPRSSREQASRMLRANVGRGLEVVLFGYLLRFQTWLVDAGAVGQWWTLRAWLPLGLGYAALVWSVNHLGDAARKAAQVTVLGVMLCVTGFVQVEQVAPGRLARLLQVDVLQAIGTSLVLLALLQRAARLLERPLLVSLLGVAVALLTDLVWRAMPGSMPHAIAGFFGKWEPAAGQPPAALFPLFPWFAYACLGAAFGALLREHRALSERLTVGVAVLGALLALLTSEAHPYMHRLFAATPWLLPPARVTFRVGIVTALCSVGYVWVGANRGRVLLDYGKTSLRIYWAHMLFAYGVLGRSLQKQSTYASWAVWATVLLASMWLLAQVGQRAPKLTALEPPPRPAEE